MEINNSRNQLGLIFTGLFQRIKYYGTYTSNITI